MFVIIDNKMGNIHSVANALKRLDVKYKISSEIHIIKSANAIIFPGVGAFPMAMENLKRLSLDKIITEKLTISNTPYLGICLGMQILFNYSEEQIKTKGLSLLDGSVKKIKMKKGYEVPHVGWNKIKLSKKNPLFARIKENSRFYYDHSYFVNGNASCSIATLKYSQIMTVAVRKNNIFGVQFHPEKSQRNGLILLRNFVNYAKEVNQW